METIRKAFDEQIVELQRDVVEMGNYVIEMLDRGMLALERQDSRLAEEVVRMDDHADALDFNIETNCMHMLALQQPMSRDLRTIASALRIITDLERIGDYASDICQVVRTLEEAPYLLPLDDITRLAHMATAMVRDAVKSFVDQNVDLAVQVCRDDDAVDELYHRVFRNTVSAMETNPRLAFQGANLILVARRLERVADHATNVAERVYYMETGKLEQLAQAHKELWAARS